MSDQNVSLMNDGSFWFPGSYSTFSDLVDIQYNAILWLSILFTVAIVFIVLLFTFRYKKSKKNNVAFSQIVHNGKLEFLWTFIPFLIVMAIFYWGFKDYLKLTVSPDNPLEVHVVGKKWFWTFEYPQDGIKSINELVVPVGEPVKLVMTSDDVLHSLFIPNFRVKRDLVPNRYSNIWFEANKTGNYLALCTEYCGDAHSNMYADIKVVTRSDYENWKKSSNSSDDLTLPKLGEKLYKSKGCNACHSIDGSMKIGPSWKGSYGVNREFDVGEKHIVDENYLRESIVYPAKKIVKGYQNVMPSYAGLLTDREINGIIEYIKTLK
jgi:cytochrome c oxidase subunit II